MIPILSKLSKRFLSTKPSAFKRFLYEKIDFSAQIIGIVGGRGSGKTTLMHQYAKASKHKSSQILTGLSYSLSSMFRAFLGFYNILVSCFFNNLCDLFTFITAVHSKNNVVHFTSRICNDFFYHFGSTIRGVCISRSHKAYNTSL